MTHWRNRVDPESLEFLLQESLNLALKTEALKPEDLQRIVVDTTVQEKAITHPTDAKIHYKAIERLGTIAKASGGDLAPKLYSRCQTNLDYGSALSPCLTNEMGEKSHAQAAYVPRSPDKRCSAQSSR